MNQLQKTEGTRRAEVGTNITFAVTVLPCEQGLLRRARRLVGSEADARDLVQETLERALRTFHAFKPGTAVWAWLRTIMNSVWIDCWRRRQVAQKIASLPLLEPVTVQPDPVATDRIDTIIERLPRAIARLPPPFREALELRMLSNWSYEAIARHLGIPIRTVGTRILRARRQLRVIIERDMAAGCEVAHAALAPLAPEPALRRRGAAAS